MSTRTLSNHFVEFVYLVEKTQATNGRAMSVIDLRLECRTQRLTEYADWQMTDLEQIEQEAARYGNETPLSQILSGEAVANSIEPFSWIDSPSPFAWT